MGKRTQKIIRIVLLAGTVISMFFVPWILVKAWIKPLPDTVQKQLEEAVDLGFEGIIVYVDEAGKPPAFYAAGYHNRDAKTPADAHSLFKIASIGKLYTAVSITRLSYYGRLNLDDKLTDFFPEFSHRIEYANKITVSNLVRHRSGIPDFVGTPDYWVHPKQTGQDRLDLVLDLPAHFEPGEKYEYSNTNYLLLARIIEKVTGISKFQYIQQEILNPLHLKNTFGSIDDVNLDEVMSGYYEGYEKDLKTDNNGVMLATAEDLGKFIRALNNGSVFKDKREQEIYSTLYKYEHTGLIPGYQSIAKYEKDLDAVVIQFTNHTNFDGYEWNLSEIVFNRILKIIRKSKS